MTNPLSQNIELPNQTYEYHWHKIASCPDDLGVWLTLRNVLTSHNRPHIYGNIADNTKHTFDQDDECKSLSTEEYYVSNYDLDLMNPNSGIRRKGVSDQITICHYLYVRNVTNIDNPDKLCIMYIDREPTFIEWEPATICKYTLAKYRCKVYWHPIHIYSSSKIQELDDDFEELRRRIMSQPYRYETSPDPSISWYWSNTNFIAHPNADQPISAGIHTQTYVYVVNRSHQAQLVSFQQESSVKVKPISWGLWERREHIELVT